MAVMHFFRGGQFEQSIVHFYTVEEDVGVGEPNKRHDVMLVQFLLKWILINDRIPGEKLAVDGVFGPTTYLWMLYCLNKAVDREGLKFLYRGMLTKDGAVWAPKMDQLTTFHDAGMMGYMNFWFRQNLPNMWRSVAADPMAPAELRKALIHRYTSDVQARILKGELV